MLTAISISHKCQTPVRQPVSASYFPDGNSPVTAVFNSASSSFEVNLPVERVDSECYVDLQPLGTDMNDDPDCVNGFLILNSASVNRLSRELIANISKKIG